MRPASTASRFGKLNIVRYFSSKGNHRAGEATVAWKYLYDENVAQ